MTSSNAKRKIIIDTDPGQNDTVAILFALVPVIFLKIRALTTTAKNVLIQLPSWNEQILRDWVNRSGLPVYAGAPICSSGKTVHYLRLSEQSSETVHADADSQKKNVIASPDFDFFSAIDHLCRWRVDHSC